MARGRFTSRSFSQKCTIISVLILLFSFRFVCTHLCISAHVRVACEHFYLLKAAQQVSCSSERGPLGAYGDGDDITVMSQLIAALDDERQGVVVVCSQLVTV